MMPLVGITAKDLSFFAFQFAKSNHNKPKLACVGLIKVFEGRVSVSDLEKDFSFHFPWGKVWKAEKCIEVFNIHFPSLDKLDELIHFLELKMKIYSAKIVVVPWFEQAKPKLGYTQFGCGGKCSRRNEELSSYL